MFQWKPIIKSYYNLKHDFIRKMALTSQCNQGGGGGSSNKHIPQNYRKNKVRSLPIYDIEVSLV